MKVRKTELFYLIVCLIVFSCLSTSGEEKWKGSIKKVSGITIVKNPKNPMYSREIVKFDEELAIGKAEGPEEYLLTHIWGFTVDDEENIYIMDSKPFRIKVFDKDGKYLRSIGREGQGPGEFRIPENIQFTHQKEIMVNDSGKGGLIFFSVDGQLLREIKNQVLILNGFAIVDTQQTFYAHVSSIREFQEKLVKSIPPYENFETLATKPSPMSPLIPPPQIRLALLPGNNLVWGISSQYELNIVDSKGRLVKKIEKEYSPVAIPSEYKSKYFGRLPPGISKESHKFSSRFPAFDLFFSDDEGRLFVKTYEKLKSTDKYILDVFDPEGRFLSRAALKVGNEISLEQEKFSIKKDRLYAKDFTEDGLPILKIYRVIWNY